MTQCECLFDVLEESRHDAVCAPKQYSSCAVAKLLDFLGRTSFSRCLRSNCRQCSCDGRSGRALMMPLVTGKAHGTMTEPSVCVHRLCTNWYVQTCIEIRYPGTCADDFEVEDLPNSVRVKMWMREFFFDHEDDLGSSVLFEEGALRLVRRASSTGSYNVSAAASAPQALVQSYQADPLQPTLPSESPLWRQAHTMQATSGSLIRAASVETVMAPEDASCASEVMAPEDASCASEVILKTCGSSQASVNSRSVALCGG
eukprot:gnl/TRDRNA2_/TRDRNA2_132177_c0_seq2.p1 gnl/TRDRNA2_/TRDRNA2_132177_c0~~gnl/TRDRNA2_/TRDRNA2_132177_c0_seq2.p1  ORF type:complete len:258 (+),score=27.93 gnl/TRDRNA2_/TRDRNA2_132177_c0_seq2:89-862(+)